MSIKIALPPHKPVLQRVESSFSTPLGGINCIDGAKQIVHMLNQIKAAIDEGDVKCFHPTVLLPLCRGWTYHHLDFVDSWEKGGYIPSNTADKLELNWSTRLFNYLLENLPNIPTATYITDGWSELYDKQFQKEKDALRYQIRNQFFNGNWEEFDKNKHTNSLVLFFDNVEVVKNPPVKTFITAAFSTIDEQQAKNFVALMADLKEIPHFKELCAQEEVRWVLATSLFREYFPSAFYHDPTHLDKLVGLLEKGEFPTQYITTESDGGWGGELHRYSTREYGLKQTLNRKIQCGDYLVLPRNKE